MSSTTSRYHCTHCGRAIFEGADLVRKVTLWDLGEYRADCYVIRRAIDVERLTRYDASLHEGWYCCRFIMMRMVVDKFGTGEALLVYTDSVVEVAAGQAPPVAKDDKGQIRLGPRDFDQVTTAAVNELRVVKFGAIWCPPCRLVDGALTKIAASGGLPGVKFFEVDIDEDGALSRRWPVSSIPFLVFFYGGRQIRLSSSRLPVRDGVIVGGLGEAALRRLSGRVLEAAGSGQTEVVID